METLWIHCARQSSQSACTLPPLRRRVFISVQPEKVCHPYPANRTVFFCQCTVVHLLFEASSCSVPTTPPTAYSARNRLELSFGPGVKVASRGCDAGMT